MRLTIEQRQNRYQRSTSAVLLEAGGGIRPVTVSGRLGESLGPAQTLERAALHSDRPLGVWGVQDGESHRLRSNQIRHDLELVPTNGTVILSNDGENILSYLSPQSQLWCDAGGAHRGDLLIAPLALFDKVYPFRQPPLAEPEVLVLAALGQRSRLSLLAC